MSMPLGSSHLKGQVLSPSVMIEEPEKTEELEEQPDRRRYFRAETIAVLIVLIVISGIITEFVASWGYIQLSPGAALGLSVVIATIIACCGSLTVIGGMATRMPEYSEMEIVFESGKDHFDHGEWGEAIEIFTKLLRPNMDHKRALYYSAKCYEKLDDWVEVKRHCKLYLKMQSRDKEVWELLATAHKRLFQYSEAEDATREAEKLT